MSDPKTPLPDAPPPEWSVPLNFERMQHAPQDRDLSAEAEVRTALATRLGLLSLEKLRFYFNTYPLAQKHVRLVGVVEAEYTQACVVTLEPLPQAVREPVTLDLVEAEAHGDDTPPEEMTVELEEPEFVENGRFDAGELAVQILAGTLDLFPRNPNLEPQTFVFGEDESVEEVPQTEAGKPSPFAALAALKRGDKH